MSGRNVVAEDAYYCIRRHRRKLERWLRSYVDDLEVHWRFFENAPETSLRNIVGDFLRGFRDVQEDYGRVEAFYYLHQVYKVDSGELLAVHDTYAREDDIRQTATLIFNELQKLRREKKSRQAIDWPEKCRQWLEI
ncbi:MAG: hypothetical protein HUJ26_04765 [Planctomycetaceae bacterium]|nr:hypothetical protein [Planctomycetaceae bacterium]